MTIALSDATQRLLEQQLRETGISTPDELVRVALQTLHQTRGEDFQSLDPGTQAALEEGLGQADRGESQPWDKVKAELRARFIDR